MSQQIQSALVKCSSFTDLASLVKDADQETTLLGYRYIYIRGFDGTLPIDALALKLMSLVKQDIKDKDAFRFAVKKINTLYVLNDSNWKNPLTLFLRIIRDFGYEVKNGIIGYNTRFYWNAYFIEHEHALEPSHLIKIPRSLIPLLTKELIETVFEDIQNNQDLENFVSCASEGVSFFGSRFIFLHEYEGNLPLKKLMLKVIELTKNKISYDKHDKNLVVSVDKIYYSKEKLNQMNYFSKVCVLIKCIFDSNLQNQWERLSSKIKNG